MSEDSESRPEGRLGRWSRLKSRGADAAPEPETPEPETPEKPKKKGAAAPVADRRFVPVMPPLAEPEEGEIAMEAAPPEALALKTQLEAEKAAREEEEEAEEERELTPEEEDAVKDLPPIDSLTKDSDFTPFFAQNVPDFLKRQAYRVLWRSNPIFNFRDGLDDYDEDFSLAKLVGKIVSEGASKPGQARANEETAKTASPEKDGGVDNKGTAVDADGEDDDVGDGEDDSEAVVGDAESGDENGAETVDADAQKAEPETPKEPGKNDVRPPDDAV